MRLKASDLHVVMAQRSIPKLGNGTIVSSGNRRAARTGPKVLSPFKANPALTTGLSEAASSLGSSRQGESSIAATADDGRGRRADERPAPGNSERFIQPGRFRQNAETKCRGGASSSNHSIRASWYIRAHDLCRLRRLRFATHLPKRNAIFRLRRRSHISRRWPQGGTCRM